MTIVAYGYGISPGTGSGGSIYDIGSIVLEETIVDVVVDPEDISVTLDEELIDVEIIESG